MSSAINKYDSYFSLVIGGRSLADIIPCIRTRISDCSDPSDSDINNLHRFGRLVSVIMAWVNSCGLMIVVYCLSMMSVSIVLSAYIW